MDLKYSKKYPPGFEIFKPVCNSVELAKMFLILN